MLYITIIFSIVKLVSPTNRWRGCPVTSHYYILIGGMSLFTRHGYYQCHGTVGSTNTWSCISISTSVETWNLINVGQNNNAGEEPLAYR
jgi:hypothetical protein